MLTINSPNNNLHYVTKAQWILEFKFVHQKNKNMPDSKTKPAVYYVRINLMVFFFKSEKIKSFQVSVTNEET